MAFSAVEAKVEGFCLVYTGKKYKVPVALHFSDAGMRRLYYLGAVDNISPCPNTEDDFKLLSFLEEDQALKYLVDLQKASLQDLWRQVVEPTKPMDFKHLVVKPFVLTRTIG